MTAPPFTGERLSLQASPIRANPFPPVTPSFISYTGCGIILNDGPVPATISTFTITPIGAAGSEYRVAQVIPEGFRATVIDRGHVRSGCGFGTAQDSDVAHPIAPQYRLRIEYVYDDGVRGTLESIATVTK